MYVFILAFPYFLKDHTTFLQVQNTKFVTYPKIDLDAILRERGVRIFSKDSVCFKTRLHLFFLKN
jgi:hypothetical protein